MKFNLSFTYLLSFFLLISASASAFAADVTIKQSTNIGIEFDLIIDATKLSAVASASSAQEINDSSIILYDNVLVAVPYGAKVNLENVEIIKSSPLEFKKGVKISKANTEERLVRLSKIKEVRGKQFISVQVNPVIGNMIVEELSVSLSFEGGKAVSVTSATSQDKYFDNIFESSFINYDQSKNWNYPTSKNLREDQPFALSITATDHPFFITDTWFKVSVYAQGIHQITGAELSNAGVPINGLASSDIRLFSGGGLQVPIENLIARPQLNEVAILIQDGGDGTFDSNDKILFYGESVDRWLHYNTLDTFVNNPYETENIYWLTVSPSFSNTALRMGISPVTGSASTIVETYQKFVHSEQDNLLQAKKTGSVDDYYTWFWTNESSFSFSVSTPNLVPSTVSNIFLGGRTYSAGGQSGYIDMTLNSVAGINKLCNNDGCSYQSNSLIDGINNFSLTMNDHPAIPAYFDYINIEYESYIVPSNDILNLTLGVGNSTSEIRVVDQFTSLPLVLNITNPITPQIVGGVTQVGGSLNFLFDMDSTKPNQIYMSSNFISVVSANIEQTTISDLRTNLSQTDLFVIAPQIFESALSNYINFRSNQGHSIRFVSLEDIVDNFSFGLYDPGAIRDFLSYAYYGFNRPSASYVLFVGDGTYDYMNYLGTNQPNYVPPFIHPFDFNEFYSDDNYCYFGFYGILDSDSSYDTTMATPDRGYDMVSSRWPVQSVSEIAVITNKIINYESQANLGAWRTNVSLVADDEFTTDSYNEAIHTIQSEELEKGHLPNIFNRDKIYLWEFPFVNRFKPEVNDKIVNSINNGTLLVNFVGHGNPDLWAHEHVFTRDDDLPRLGNIDKLPLIFTASCEIAFFDNPQREGMAEELLAMSNGGGIGVISATRRVFSSPNAAFNKEVFDYLMYDRSLTIAEAMYTAKLKRQYLTGLPKPVGNDQAYIFFGDPLLKLGIPKYDINFTQKPDSLVALTPTTISGEIINIDSSLVISDGEFVVTVYDSDRQKRHYVLDPSGNPINSVDYKVTGPQIFRGSGTISAGTFEFSFIPPLDIGFGGSGAKVSVYALLSGTDGFGLLDSISVSGNIQTTSDSVGPQISYAVLGNSDFNNGDVINSDDIFEITITDSSGINLSGGLGHGISLEIDGNSETVVNLTDLFEYDLNSFTTGKLNYSASSLTAGNHTLKLKAWDNANNSSVTEFEIQLIGSQKIEIVELLNYPNPMQDSTLFSYSLTQPTEKFSIEIFTLSGRKIKSFQINSFQPSGQYQNIVWHGDDYQLDRVATGVYIYKAVAYSAISSEVVESFGKIILIN